LPRNSKSTATARRRGGQAGFTLLELLVALTLLGLVLAVIFGELRFTTRAWDAADAKLDRNGELLSVHSFVRQRLQQIHVRPPNVVPDGENSPVIFDGNSRSMEFLGTMPANVSEGGFYEISLSSQIGEDGNELFISWRPFDEDGTRRVADTSDNSRVLLRGVREVRFSYFGQTGDNVTPQWWDIWPSRDAAPSLIRLRVSFEDDDPRSWPELMVAPAVANAVLRLP
jgi:general secretion pathway protein J